LGEQPSLNRGGRPLNCHGADPRLAALPGHQRAQKRLAINRIRLGAPVAWGTARALAARGAYASLDPIAGVRTSASSWTWLMVRDHAALLNLSGERWNYVDAVYQIHAGHRSRRSPVR
jgi:hypothetical protein